MRKVEKMTIAVVVKASGKVEGIRGLYMDASSHRFYVRYAKDGRDRQLTVSPRGETFTALSRAASKGLTELKREVELELGNVNSGASRGSKRGDFVAEGVQALPQVIEAVWTQKGVSARTIKELKNYTSGLALCGVRDKKAIEAIDAYNSAEMAKKLEGSLSDCSKVKMYGQIKAVFKSLIEKNRHFGQNPTMGFDAPRHTAQREEREISFADMKKILDVTKTQVKETIRQKELTLFFRLLSETGQRPIDVYRFDSRKIENHHYRFSSHKTGKIHRVSHLLSDTTLSLIEEIKKLRGGLDVFTWEDKNSVKAEKIECFWSLSWRVIQQSTRALCSQALGEGAKLYTTRHHFISEIFRRTGSEFWASAFTHEGENANQKHYLHVGQMEADRILKGFLEDFERAVSGKGEGKVSGKGEGKAAIQRASKAHSLATYAQRDEELWADRDYVF